MCTIDKRQIKVENIITPNIRQRLNWYVPNENSDLFRVFGGKRL